MLWMILIWIHITAAMFWIGGMLFFSIVLVPSLRGLPIGQRSEVMSRIGRRFRKTGWISLGVLLVTGLLQLYRLGIPVFMGGWIWAKLVMVVLMVSLTLLHEFVLGPRSIEMSRKVGPGAQNYGAPLKVGPGAQNYGAQLANPTPHPLQRTVRWMARFNLIIGLFIVLASVYLART